MKPKYYYHLTDKEHLPEILKHGIKPMLGENSELVSEEKPAIYLCQYKDLPFWKILLDKSIVLQIQDLNNVSIEKFTYSNYDEYITYDTIPAEKIKQVYTPKPKTQHMKTLCLNYISTTSRCCEIAARHYTENYHKSKDYTDYLNTLLTMLITIKDRLNFSVLTKKEIRAELRFWGDNGAFTFCDTYLDTDHRMWEQLIYYPVDELSEKRKQVYDWIATTFKGCLTVNTGGWTG